MKLILLLSVGFWQVSALAELSGFTGSSGEAPFLPGRTQTPMISGYPPSAAGSVEFTSSGATLSAPFQKLEAQVTQNGLSLFSTDDLAASDTVPFVIKSIAVGRSGGVTYQLPQTGEVTVGDRLIAFSRDGVIEEYRTGVDGIRQDFVVHQHVPGEGPLILQLAMHGVEAEERTYGAQLVLKESGRAIAYHQLKVWDASGKLLDTKMDLLSPDRMLIRVEDESAVYPIRIDPTYSDADWISVGGLPGADDTVNALVDDGAGNLYLGGEFNVVGNLVVNHVAKWDGNQWSALGLGVDGEVSALAVSGNMLYVGGLFTTAGGNPASNIAAWNGSSWSPLGNGVNDEVRALLVSDGLLYVGGYFTSAGGGIANRIASWNGSSWSALGSGISNIQGYDTSVRALIMFDGQLHAGGSFTTAGGNPALSIARWNGNTWSSLASGLGRADLSPRVMALAEFGGELIAAGRFTTPIGATATNIAKWNGSQWSALGLGVNNDAHALIADGETLYVGGRFTKAGGINAKYIATWNGSTWSTLGEGMQNSVDALAMFDNALYVGGTFDAAGGVAANYIATWEGGLWSSFGTGFNNKVLAMTVSGSNLFVGGTFTSVPGTNAHYVAKWNGSVWSSLGSGMDQPVRALAATDDNLYAGGDFDNAGGIPASLIAQWNGTNWAPLGQGVTGGIFGGVRTLLVKGADLYVGGYFNEAGGVAVNSVARWNGTSWSALEAGLTDDGEPATVLALTAFGSDIYAGGAFTKAGNTSARNIARWNGSSWSAVGGGLTSILDTSQINEASAYALAVSGDSLYVGGLFDFAGGSPIKAVARWSQNSWSSLGSGLEGQYPEVDALAAVDEELFVGGVFTNAGGISAEGLASWDGTDWSSVGTLLSNSSGSVSVDAIAMLGEDLYVAGDFILAGGEVSPYLAIARPGAGPVYSGPFVVFESGQATIFLLVTGDGNYEIHRNDDLNPLGWEPIGTTSGGADGYISFVDPNPPPSGAYYRAVLVP